MCVVVVQERLCGQGDQGVVLFSHESSQEAICDWFLFFMEDCSQKFSVLLFSTEKL